jgi:hypothetical protein
MEALGAATWNVAFEIAVCCASAVIPPRGHAATAQAVLPTFAWKDADRMVRGAGKETILGRLFPARSLKSPSAKLLARWFVIAFCLVFWAAILIAFIL